MNYVSVISFGVPRELSCKVCRIVKRLGTTDLDFVHDQPQLGPSYNDTN